MFYPRCVRSTLSAALVAGSVVAISIATSAPSAAAPLPTPTVAGAFQELTPQRVLDTRTGNGAALGSVLGGHTLTLQVTGRGGVPATGVSAVALNVTVIAPTRPGYLKVYGHSATQPGTSTLSYALGQTVANLTIVKLGADGKVDLHLAGLGRAHLAADVSGYYLSGTPTLPGTFAALTPQRLLDTRVGVGAPKKDVPGGATLTLQATGRGDVPATGVSAVALNIAVVDPTQFGYLAAYGHSATRPHASTLTYAAGRTATNLAIVKVGADGKVDLHLYGVGMTNLVADVSGYVLSGPANEVGTYTPLTPQRLLDTRVGNGAPLASVASEHTLTLQATGRGDVPDVGVSAVAINVAVVGATAGSYLTVWQHGAPQPHTSTLTVTRGATVANLVIVKVGADGKVDLRLTGGGRAHLVGDVSGYFLSVPLAPSLTLTKSETPGDGVTVTAGQTAPISYLLELTNGGGTATGPVTVTDTIPPGTTYVPGSASCGGGPACSVAATATTVTWTLTTVARVSTANLSFQVSVDATDANGSTITNTAAFSNVNTPGCSIPICPSNTVTNPVITPASIAVVKSEPTPGAGTTVIPGQATPVSYQFAVENSGATPTASFTLSDAVPGGTTYVPDSATCPAGMTTATTPSCTIAVGATITWTFSAVPALTTYDTFGFQVSVNPEATGGTTITNKATFPNINTPACSTPTCDSNTISNPVDTPPLAVDDSATVTEDSSANTINVLANDTDSDAGPKTVTAITQPAHGAVVIVIGGTGVTYAPTANYCNTQVGGSPDTFDYTLNGGSTASVSVTVTCVDDPPTAVNDAATVAEDSAAATVGVLANDTDFDSGPKTITSASDPANGTVVLTGGVPGAHTGLTYAPKANYCNTQVGGTADTFSYTLNGGSVGTVSMTVTCSPDSPVVGTSPGALGYTENSPAAVIDAAVTVTDPDTDAVIASAKVQITTNYVGTEDVLALAGSHAPITASFVGDTLTLTGNAGPAAYQAALRDVTYRNSSDGPSTATRTLTFTVVDQTALAGSDTRGIAITASNDAPTDIALTNPSVAENKPSGTLVGLLSGTDADQPGDTLTFSFVTGSGSDDNGQFEIVGTELRTAAAFDFETTATYSILVRVSDGNGGVFDKVFTIFVTDVNDAPTDIALSPSSVGEGQPSGTTVGTLSAADQDEPGDTFTFSLVAGPGSTDNASFTVSGLATLQTTAALDFNAGPTRSIRVSVSDGHGGTFEKQLTVTVNDVNQDPTNITLSASAVAENQPVNTIVATLSATDPDVGDTFTFTLVAGAGSTDNASFNVATSSLRTSASFDFETKSSYSIRVGVSDGHGGTMEKQFTITVTNANDPPTDIALTDTGVAENQPSGTLVGLLSGTDADPLDTLGFSLVAGVGSSDNAQFQISGAQLLTGASFDFETKSSYAIRVRVSDGHTGTFDEQFTISVTDVNDAPTDIVLTPSSVDEALPSGTAVGALTATDQDQPGDTFAYTLVAGAGSADNASFTISDSTVHTAAVFDFNTKSSYAIRVGVTDGHGGTFQKPLTVTVNNVNQAPTNIALTAATVAENQPVNTVVGALSATDPDTGDTFTFTLVAGTGSTDNASFNILGTSLHTSASFDFETKSSYAILVRATDAGGLTFDKQLTITVTNVNEAPTDIALSSASVPENQPSGTAVGILSSTDPDSGGTHSYTLVAGPGSTDNAKFAIVGSTLQTA
ncbi:MAG: large repetitive protein, partial [Pseudonocardiales bacterium]|nr:large repetitive protein [Pseudonocardiales bacterium]